MEPLHVCVSPFSFTLPVFGLCPMCLTFLDFGLLSVLISASRYSHDTDSFLPRLVLSSVFWLCVTSCLINLGLK